MLFYHMYKEIFTDFSPHKKYTHWGALVALILIAKIVPLKRFKIVAVSSLDNVL